MRIIAGELGGRSLKAPAGTGTRPSSARLREGLASALDARGAIASARVLDLFAGSGALGLEALSRGASALLAIDRDRRALRCIAENVQALGLRPRARWLSLDLFDAEVAARRIAAAAEAPFELVFADPPYAHVQAACALLMELQRQGALAEDAIAVLEHPGDVELSPETLSLFELLPRRRYGDSAFSLAIANALAS
ncbi:MAG: 16S rRNA (guanine(966)-N(2))-methyltransferase RsmD [Myxococcales bacterium]|nr:16S rRNA (guanine(966)-N(2))-methyltransferase RsmD [Myxococcales bacterium]